MIGLDGVSVRRGRREAEDLWLTSCARRLLPIEGGGGEGGGVTLSVQWRRKIRFLRAAGKLSGAALLPSLL